MADAYIFPVCVDLEENTASRVKVKLVRHFQSKKNNGGDCEVDHEPGSRTATVRFRREQDQRNVVTRRVHQIQLDSGPVTMTVRLPTEDKPSLEEACDHETKASLEEDPVAEKKRARGEEEDKDPHICAVVLGNLPESVNREFLEMLVENVADPSASGEPVGFTVEMLTDLRSAVVTFQKGKENINFVKKCKQNRTVVNKKLTIQPLEPTKQIVAEDVKDLDEDLLHLYFEHNCGKVEDIEMNKDDQSALITFTQHQAVSKVMEKKHHIRKKDISVFPFYKSLGRALYGKEKRPSPKLPAPFSESVDVAVCKFLDVIEPAAEFVKKELAKHHCDVTLSQSTVHLSPLPSMLQQKDAKTFVRDWTVTVKSALTQALSNFRQLKLRPDLEVWDECDLKIKDVQQSETVIIHKDKIKGDYVVVGYRSDIDGLENTLCGIIDEIMGRLRWQKLKVTQEVKVPSSIFNILCQDGLKDKLKQVYPQLILFYQKEDASLKLTGLSEEIIAASKVIVDATLSLKRQNLELDEFIIELLKGEQQEEVTEAFLESAGINAVFDIGDNRVQLLAVTDKALNDAQQHLKELLISQYVDVEDSNVLKNTEWQQLVTYLENANSKPCRRTQIRTKGNQVVVSGHVQNARDVSNELEDFLTQNTQIELTVTVKPSAKLRYLQTMHTSWMNQFNNKVVLTYTNDDVCLSGTRLDATESSKVIEDLLSSVFFEILTISKPGVKKLFQEKESMYVSILKNDTGCMVELVDDTNGSCDGFNVARGPTPLFQLQTADGVEIVLCKADLCSYPTHAVVNSSNSELKHKVGLGAALLKAAGPQLQDDCDKIIQKRGKLRPGDCVITNAGGQLCCKRIIHAVAPVFDAAKPLKAPAQLKRAVKGSLELAEANGCLSVAIPVISRGLGFPLSLCAVTIVKAVKEHCDEKCEDSILKRIDFVNNDDNAVQAMEAAIKQEFGKLLVSPSHQGLPDQPTHRKPVQSDQNLYNGQTKEGLDISLAKGCIENANTDVIVNIVAENLQLNQGTISKALLHTAGDKLQELVKAKASAAQTGDIVVTDGCKLKCKQVYHAVAPHWKKGDPKAETALRKVISDCLNLMEKAGLSSITFPAIGTGNLGFPKDQAATIMYQEILAFSNTTKPQHVGKIRIVLFSGDVATVQAFCQEFKKEFPTSSTISSPGYFSKIVSSQGMYETKLGSVSIQVSEGDITKESSDAIVNSSNSTFTLKSGVSKAILEAAGPAVEAECQQLGALNNSGLIVTQGGNLSCKKILHLVGQTDPLKIQQAVNDALTTCLNHSFTSVSFPALGTGQGNVNAKQVADAMLDAVINVLSLNTNHTLTTVRIVIFQPPMLKEFHSSLEERQVTGNPTDTKKPTDTKIPADAKNPADTGFWHNVNSKIKALFNSTTPQKTQPGGDFLVPPVQMEPARFHICGDSKSDIDRAKQWINHTVVQELESLTIYDDAILQFSDSDQRRIVEVQKQMGVGITTESKQSRGSLLIEGLSKDVLLASQEIHGMLAHVRSQEERRRKVELAGTVAEWQYKESGAHFSAFDAQNNFLLEQASEKQQVSVKVSVLGRDYTVHIPSEKATDGLGNTLDIRRVDKLRDEDVPENWEPMKDSSSSLAVLLQPGTPEHTEVLSLFKASCSRAVTQIERIQNPVLWKSLMIKKRQMEEHNGHQNNERRLFHGTCHSTVGAINEHGFNRAFAGKNAAHFGNGSYFAVKANYSAQDTYSKPNQKGEKMMYLCRVLTGDFALGQSGMVVPPLKPSQGVAMYDSVVDNEATPNMFVIFHDSHAYPEYLISFK